MEGDYFREQFVVELVEQVSFLFQAVFQEKHQLLLYFSFLATLLESTQNENQPPENGRTALEA
jgi:hypothetical protein